MMLKRLEDATASLGERSITGYAETACRRARMYVPLVAVWKTVPCPNPYDNKVASFRRFTSSMALADAEVIPINPRTFSASLRMYEVIDRSQSSL